MTPDTFIAVGSTAINIASGVYHAGVGMPKFKLFQALYKLVPTSPPFNKQEEELVTFLVQSLILLRPEDFKNNIEDKLPQIYMLLQAKGYLLSEDPISGEMLNAYLSHAKGLYKEFSDVYEKISSKGASPTAPSTISNITIEIQTEPRQRQNVALGQIDVDMFRKNFVEFCTPANLKNKKKNDQEDDKEIDISESAKTNCIDTQPIACRINNQVIYVNPRNVQRHQTLSRQIKMRASGASELINTDVTMPALSVDNQSNINAGIKQFLDLKSTHSNDEYLKKNLVTVGALSNSNFFSNEFHDYPPETTVHLLAIATILRERASDDIKITKEMSLSRIVTLGHLKGDYDKNTIFSGLVTVKSVEKMKNIIDEKLGKNSDEGRKLKETLDNFTASADAVYEHVLMQQYVDEIIYDERPTKPPLDSIIEFCEADATAKEYIKSTEETFLIAQPYLQAEAEKVRASNHTLPLESQKFVQNLSILSSLINSTSTAYQAEPIRLKSEHVSASSGRERDDLVTNLNTESLNTFDHILETRIQSKKAVAQDPVKKIKNTILLKKDNSTKKIENIHDYLQEAQLLLRENLIYALEQGPSKYKSASNTLALNKMKTEQSNLEIQSSDLISKIRHAEQMMKETKSKSENNKDIADYTSDMNMLEETIEKMNLARIKIAEKTLQLSNMMINLNKILALKSKSESDIINISEISAQIDSLTIEIENYKKDLHTESSFKSKLESTIKLTINSNAEVQEYQRVLNEHTSSYHQYFDELDDVSDKMSNLMDEIAEQESLLADPVETIKKICDSMNNARKNINQEINETTSETLTQKMLFYEFYNALMKIVPSNQGMALATEMKNYVDQIDAQNKTCSINLSQYILSQNATQPTSSVQHLDTNPDINWNDVTIDTNMLNTHVQLLAALKQLESEKASSSSTPSSKKDEISAMIAQLENTEDNSLLARYATEANKIDSPNGQTTLQHLVKDKAMLTDRTPYILKLCNTHLEQIKAHASIYSSKPNVSQSPLDIPAVHQPSPVTPVLDPALIKVHAELIRQCEALIKEKREGSDKHTLLSSYLSTLEGKRTPSPLQKAYAEAAIEYNKHLAPTDQMTQQLQKKSIFSSKSDRTEQFTKLYTDHLEKIESTSENLTKKVGQTGKGLP